MDGTAFERLWVWRDPAVARALRRYRAVACDRLPARFLLAARVPVSVDPATADAAALHAELVRRLPGLHALQARADAGEEIGEPVAPSLLDLAAALARRWLAPCVLCRWHCRVDRTRPGRRGVCRLDTTSRVSCAFHHLGEELPIRGTHGSGTVFFSSCNMRCAFCQNGDIARDCREGEPVDARLLATLAWKLRREGCHNLNLVGGEPTVHLPVILDALVLLARGFAPEPGDLRRAAAVDGDRFHHWPPVPGCGDWHGRFNVPVLWNSNMYFDRHVLDLLRVVVDIWLPDFKFGPGRCAVELARTPRYFATVTANLAALAAAGEEVLVRHLVMPEHLGCCTFPVLDWLARHMPGTPVNIMDQYHPDMATLPGSPHFRERFRSLARRPWESEIAAAFDHARALGLPFATVSLERRRLYA